MSEKPSIPVKTALVSQFNEAHGVFMAAATAAAPNIVKAVNGMRTMGILIKELLGRENITENCLREWLRENPAALAEKEVAWLMNYVRTANKLQQGELGLFADASGFVQITMQCAGLLPPDAQRQIAQSSHELTPSVQSWKFYTDFKVRFEGMIKAAPQWDAEQRAAVKENIEKTRAFLCELEGKL